MLVFKRLHLNLLNIVTFLTLKSVLVDQPTILKTIYTIFKLKLSNPIIKETVIFLSQLSVPYQNKKSLIIHRRFGHVSISRLKLMARKGLVEGLPKNISDLEEP